LHLCDLSLPDILVLSAQDKQAKPVKFHLEHYKKTGRQLALQAFAPFTPPCMAETGAEHVSMKKVYLVSVTFPYPALNKTYE